MRFFVFREKLFFQLILWEALRDSREVFVSDQHGGKRQRKKLSPPSRADCECSHPLLRSFRNLIIFVRVGDRFGYCYIATEEESNNASKKFFIFRFPSSSFSFTITKLFYVRISGKIPLIYSMMLARQKGLFICLREGTETPISLDLERWNY